MAEANGNGGSFLRNWGALALAAGAMFWTAASQWGGRDATVSAILAGINDRLNGQAARMTDLQQQFVSADREVLQQAVQAQRAIQAVADAVVRLTTTIEIYGQDRARLIADYAADRAELRQRMDGVQRELQALRERVIVFTGRTNEDDDKRRP